jgi:hypothetical protein
MYKHKDQVCQVKPISWSLPGKKETEKDELLGKLMVTVAQKFAAKNVNETELFEFRDELLKEGGFEQAVRTTSAAAADSKAGKPKAGNGAKAMKAMKVQNAMKAKKAMKGTTPTEVKVAGVASAKKLAMKTMKAMKETTPTEVKVAGVGSAKKPAAADEAMKAKQAKAKLSKQSDTTSAESSTPPASAGTKRVSFAESGPPRKKRAVATKVASGLDGFMDAPSDDF